MFKYGPGLVEYVLIFVFVVLVVVAVILFYISSQPAPYSRITNGL